MSKVSISSPRIFETVDFEFTVCGKVNPAHSSVQVYVQAADDKWYLQKETTKRGSHWSVPCHFGDETHTIGVAYAVVAIVTKERPTSPVDILPDGEKSDVVLVFRQ